MTNRQHQLEREQRYGYESVALMRLGLTDKLRAILEAAEDLEARGVAWEDAWQSNEDWQRLGRIALLLLEANASVERSMSRERHAAWDERMQARLGLRRVK